MSDDLSNILRKVNLEKDLQQSKINILKTEISCLQASQKQLLSKVDELKSQIHSQNKDSTSCKDHHLQTKISKTLNNNEDVEYSYQDINDLKQKMEAQTKMLELTINVYLKEKFQCNDELTKDELKLQKRLHKLMFQKAKRQKW